MINKRCDQTKMAGRQINLLGAGAEQEDDKLGAPQEDDGTVEMK